MFDPDNTEYFNIGYQSRMQAKFRLYTNYNYFYNHTMEAGPWVPKAEEIARIESGMEFEEEIVPRPNSITIDTPLRLYTQSSISIAKMPLYSHQLVN